MIKTGTVVRLHLFREHLDVLIAIVASLVIMFESGYANAWVFLGGHFVFSDFNTYVALGRGVFIEALVFIMFKLVKVFAIKRGMFLLLLPIPLVIGSLAMIVSAGCNLGWVNSSGEMPQVLATVALYLPPIVLTLFKFAMGLLFPIAVGALALFDLEHLLDTLFSADALRQKAMVVEIAEHTRSKLMDGQKKAANELNAEYLEMARADARNNINKVKAGDRSFGMNELQTGPLAAPTSVKRITPALPVGGPPQLQLPNPSQQKGQVSFPAQSSTVPLGAPSTGNTQQLTYPMPSLPPNPGPNQATYSNFPSFGQKN